MTEAVVDRTYLEEPEKHEYKPAPLRAVDPPVADEQVSESVAVERVREGVADKDDLPRLPMQLIRKYADLAARHATLKRVEDGELFATIPGFPGVWAKEATEDRVLQELREVVEDWAVLKIQHEDRDLPELDEINLNVL